MMQLTDDIIAEVSARADLGTLSSDTHITLNQMRTWVDISARRLMGYLVEVYGEDYFLATQTIQTVVDQPMVTLTRGGVLDESTEDGAITDIYRLQGLRVTVDGYTAPIERCSVNELGLQEATDTTGWQPGAWPRYHYSETATAYVFRWTRTPRAVHDVTLYYTPFHWFVDTDGGNTWPGANTGNSPAIFRGNVWDEYVVWDCVAQAYMYQDLPTEMIAMAQGRRDECLADVRRQAPRRQNQPMRIQRRWRHALLRGGEVD